MRVRVLPNRPFGLVYQYISISVYWYNGVDYDSMVKKDYISSYTQTDLYMIGYVLNRGFLNYFNPEWVDI